MSIRFGAIKPETALITDKRAISVEGRLQTAGPYIANVYYDPMAGRGGLFTIQLQLLNHFDDLNNNVVVNVKDGDRFELTVLQKAGVGQEQKDEIKQEAKALKQFYGTKIPI
jgi:hypothetical protein